MTPTLEKAKERSLDERYLQPSGAVYLTGIQAIVRLMLDQQRRDTDRGVRTAAFVSGYEGSPLGGLDIELARHSKLLQTHHLVQRPGVNEELAATSVAGTQLAAARPDARYQGVVGYWYGKAPGLDRATDALRHANLIGTHPEGGALALVGDDPLSKSSTVPSASEAALAELGMPTFYPADSQELIELGLHAIALSRASGLWSAMKVVTNVADGGCDVLLPENAIAPVFPDPTETPGVFQHVVNAQLLGAVPVVAEESAYGIRLDVARSYARLNGVNQLDSRRADDRIGIVAAGKTYLDLLQALEGLGLDERERERRGIRLLRIGMLFPLEPSIVTEFAEGLEQVLVVEEKRAFLETGIKDLLYGTAGAPAVVGKRDEAGGPLVPVAGELNPDLIAMALARALGGRDGLQDLTERLAKSAPPKLPVLPPVAGAVRTPYFCSGCPHNTSTQVPEDSVVGAGIGCHGMVMLMEPKRVGDVIGVTQMGGEGAQWVGMSPFVETEHLLQNIGDGTFHHSGSLALRAAVAGGVNITYKLLYNSAVAMTGGQRAVGLRSVPELTELLAAEGVARIIVTTEDRARYRGIKLSKGTEVWDRDRLEEAQTTLAATAGVTVLIHDQECATEKRRNRKRNPPKKAEMRVVINERVCEGCGDCGAKSNCLSVEPVETEYGRKTRIHQGSCNTDYSCLKGDCPSFLSVIPAKGGAKLAAAPAIGGDRPQLPDPVTVVCEDELNVRLTGIGGTGVVTVAQIIAQAAHLTGRHVRNLDQTGLSQKAGPVVSDVKISRRPLKRANKLGEGECDLYLGCDILVAASRQNLAVARPSRTVAVVSTGRVATGAMITDPDAPSPDLAELIEPIRSVACHSTFIDGRQISQDELGGDQFANVVMLGAAFQSGALPLPLKALEEAIELNGVAVAQNLKAFELGRRAALGEVEGAADGVHAVEPKGGRDGAEAAALVKAAPGSELAHLVLDRAGELIAYQGVSYARSYAELIERVRVAEFENGAESQELTEVAARNLYKLMAYKDEYEVARLSLDPQLTKQIEAQFGAGSRIAWRLHPPILRALGLDRKISVRRWWGTPLFRFLRATRRLRGTKVDPFGFARIRREERRIAREYRKLLGDLAERLTPANHAIAVELAALPDMVRGYEDIKQANIARYETELDRLLTKFDAA